MSKKSVSQDSVDHTNQKVTPGLFELISQLAGAITAGTILFSVLYNWAYFETVYPSGLQLFTISDHIASTLELLPVTFALGCVGWMIGYFKPLSKIFSKGEKGKKYSNDEWRKIRRTQYIFWFAFYLIGTLLFLLFSSPAIWVYIGSGAIVLWSIFGNDLFEKSHISWRTQLLLLLLPPYCVLALMYGNGRAFEDLSSSTGNIQILIKNHAPLDGALVLRYLDKGIIFRLVHTDDVLYTPWDQIEQISVSGIKVESRVRACIWFGIACNLRPAESHS